MPRPPVTILDLLGRGQIAYSAYLARTRRPDDMPLGVGSLNIVTRVDFELHAGMCLDYIRPHRVIHILTDSGQVFALLASHVTL